MGVCGCRDNYVSIFFPRKFCIAIRRIVWHMWAAILEAARRLLAPVTTRAGKPFASCVIKHFGYCEINIFKIAWKWPCFLSLKWVQVSLEYLSPHHGFTWDRNLNANQHFFFWLAAVKKHVSVKKKEKKEKTSPCTLEWLYNPTSLTNNTWRKCSARLFLWYDSEGPHFGLSDCSKNQNNHS